jgi:prepilin-type N-terminal cleavage/methylation domain-containing protein
VLNSKGFTIVEVIVALLVLVIGLLSTASTFAAAARNFESGHASVTASARAKELLEAARVRGCDGARAGSAIENMGVFYWTAEEMGSDLQLVTVIYSPRLLRTRADTFSAVVPC